MPVGRDRQGWRKVLSDREREISDLVSHEFTNEQIGEKLNISDALLITEDGNGWGETLSPFLELCPLN